MPANSEAPTARHTARSHGFSCCGDYYRRLHFVTAATLANYAENKSATSIFHLHISFACFRSAEFTLVRVYGASMGSSLFREEVNILSVSTVFILATMGRWVCIKARGQCIDSDTFLGLPRFLEQCVDSMGIRSIRDSVGMNIFNSWRLIL